MRARYLLAAALALFVVWPLGPGPAHAAPDLVHIQSQVRYDIIPEEGPVRVQWDISIQNNDPQTARVTNAGSSQYYYQSFTFPLLTGATNVKARSATGATLDVDLGDPGQGLVAPATVHLDKPLYYQDSYSIQMQYELPETRHSALIVIPAYTFVPLLASGDEAVVEVTLPSGGPWTTSLEAADCVQQDATFRCSGEDTVFVAGLAEAARLDLTTTLTTQVQLRDQLVRLNITYFQGEEAFAQHIAALTGAALPVIEDLYGVTYPGAPEIQVSERVRQAILGYEGLTHCDTTACEVNVAPIADDYTVLHELAHLWSSMYASRWLAEGFAQFISLQAAAYLPEGLLTGEPPAREQPAVDLQLDDWGEVQSVIGASEDKLAVENAGYFRSLRFLEQLEFELGLETLRRTNQAIVQTGVPADSRRFMDLLEDASGRNNDGLFKEWVFPDSMDSILTDRREARDRLTNLVARAQQEGLTEEVPARIQEKIEAWQFDEAFAALEEAERGLEIYDELKADLARLRADVTAAGLVLTGDIDRLIADWDFQGAQALVRQASAALAAYNAARDKLAEPRNLWERFGLLGRDPESLVERAAAAFNDGEYQTAIDRANDAIEAIDGASTAAMRRVLIVAGVLGLFALVVLGAVWLSRRGQPDFA